MPVIRPNTNQRSNNLPVDEDLEAGIVVVYGINELGQWAPLDTTRASTESAANLTQRMFAKIPQTGYEMWWDVDDVDHPTYIIFAEAPSGQTDESQLVWNGIRLPFNPNNKVVGRIIERTGFAWTNRATGW